MEKPKEDSGKQIKTLGITNGHLLFVMGALIL